MGSQRTVRAIAVSLVITAVTAAAVLFLGFDRHAAGDGGAQVSYNTVDVRAQMLKNGDLRVTQTFDYRLRPRGTPWRQMFQQYTLSSDRVTNISDISIKDLTTGRVYTQDTTVHSPGGYGDYGWNSECAGRWYIADITRSQTAPSRTTPSWMRSHPPPWASRSRRRMWRSGGTSRPRPPQAACALNCR